MHLSKKILLTPYIPSVLFLLVALVDYFFLGGAVKQLLPTSPYSVFVYYALFEFPHIIASFFVFGDKDYRAAYRDIFKKRILILLLLTLVAIVVNFQAFLVLYITYTLYHVVMQQFGIAKFYTLVESKFLRLVSYCYIAMGSIAYLSFSFPVPQKIFTILPFISIFLFLLFFVLEHENRKNVYLTLFLLSFISASILFGMGYALLGLLSIRIVHDITAFFFYSTHNYNRKKDGENPLFTSRLTRAIHPLLLTPLLAIIINVLFLYLLNASKGNYILNILLLFIYFGCAIAHYYIEGSLWKKGSLARNYIHVS